MLLRNIISLTLLVALVQIASAADEIVPIKGSVIEGTVTSMSKDEVTISSGGVPRKVPVSEIREIKFDGEPFELSTVRRFVRDGQYDQALDRLADVKASGLSANVQAELAFLKAVATARFAMAGSGDKADARNLVTSFLSGNPKNYRYYEAAEAYGDISVAMDDLQKAVTGYKVVAGSSDPAMQQRAAMRLASVNQALGEYDTALTAYESVLSSAEGETKLMATLGKAECLAATGKPQEGVQLAQSIIANNDAQQTDLFARAYVALGNCHLQANKSKEALMAFLMVDVVFPNADPDLHAEALYNLSKLWRSQHPERATAARNLLKQRYPGSRWAGKLDTST